MLRDVSYNVVGRLAAAGFPVILPVIAYWVYGQTSMLKVAQSFNLTSYIAVLALSGFALPARDFRADRANPKMMFAHMRSYIRLTVLQVGLAVAVLLCIWNVSSSVRAGLPGGPEFAVVFFSIGLVQVSTICAAVPAGFFISMDRHALPNIAAAISRALAVMVLLVSGFLHLPLSLVAYSWMLIFAFYAAYVWTAALRLRDRAVEDSILPSESGFVSILRRSSVYLLWSVLATVVLAVPLTYIAYRWPQDFGGMNYAFLIGSSAAAIVTAALVPMSNRIQDSAGDAGVIAGLLSSSWKLSLKVLLCSATGFLLTWPFHALVVGQENVWAFRVAAPLVFLTTSIRLATWLCTQCAIAIRSESVVMLGPIAEAALALGLAWMLSQSIGVIGVPAGLALAATGRVVFMMYFEVPKIRAAWGAYEKV